MKWFKENNKCISCGRTVDKLYNKAGGIEVSTGGWCKECKKKKDKNDLELLESIINGKDISDFL